MQAQHKGRKSDLLEKEIAYQFSDKTLLQESLTHPSCAVRSASGQAFHNQRLEFLGDAVLAVILAEALFKHYPEDAEGHLSRKLTALVKGATLSKMAQTIDLGEYLTLSESEHKQGGRALASNLENAMEALLGAVYLDGGLHAAQAIVLRLWDGEIQQARNTNKDPKTALQEAVQGKGLPLPNYVLLREEGASHAPVFTVEVQVQGHVSQQAQGASKKQAERAAAAVMLEKL